MSATTETSVRALRVAGLGISHGPRALVRDVSFAIEPGERVGLIGASGSGKSLTALALLGLLPDGLTATGSVRLAGVPHDLVGAEERTLARLRGARMSMVFQEPLTALNPLRRVGHQVAEVVRIHRRDLGRDASAAYARDLLARVRLPDPAAAARAYPHQLSGGQRQRVLLAIALANTPDLLVCDEPTSALDVTVQAQILDLLRPPTLGPTTSLLFISHDLAVVAAVCERVLVMSGGTIVDGGPVTEILRRPRHPYTRALLDAASGVTRTGAARAARAPLPSGAARPDPSSGPDPDPGSAGQPGRVASGDAGLLVEAVGLCRRYTRGRRSLLGGPVVVHALRDVNLRIRRGERLGVVGESGSGKSTLVRILAGLDRPTGGTVRYGGVDLGRAPERQRRRLRADLGVVFQDPTSSLDPRMRVGQIVAEPLVARHGPAGERRRDRVVEVLASVGLPADAADRFPHEFSGGERQRISIARALVARPTVLIADEPVSALDASVRAQILDLLHELAETYDLTLVLVSHDLAVVRQLCDTVAVLHEGRLVESGPTEQVYTAPTHPYTRDLLAAVPRLPDTREGP